MECPELLAAIGENNVPIYLHSVRTRKDVTNERTGNTKKRKLASRTWKV